MTSATSIAHIRRKHAYLAAASLDVPATAPVVPGFTLVPVLLEGTNQPLVELLVDVAPLAIDLLVEPECTVDIDPPMVLGAETLPLDTPPVVTHVGLVTRARGNSRWCSFLITLFLMTHAHTPHRVFVDCCPVINGLESLEPNVVFAWGDTSTSVRSMLLIKVHLGQATSSDLGAACFGMTGLAKTCKRG